MHRYTTASTPKTTTIATIIITATATKANATTINFAPTATIIIASTQGKGIKLKLSGNIRWILNEFRTKLII